MAIRPKNPPSLFLFFKAGLPLVLFSVGASYVVKSAIEGKQKEADVAQGKISKSERQVRLQKEQDDMLSKITKIRNTDFNNTKRIERPEEILERRRKERERRNSWYRVWWRRIAGKD